MSVLKPGSDRQAGALRRGAALAALLLAAAPALADTPPARVVSMNLCTDQLAMLLAAPGQLVSVSHLASDPLSSSMVAEAAAFPANRGGAEQIFLMHPDLVLAGTYTSLASVSLLRDLGVTVVQVPPVTALDEIPAQIRTVGAALSRDAQAEALVAEFQAGLAALVATLPPRRAALYYPNGYTVGEGTLADDVLRHAGFDNIGARAGLTGGGTLPLERLVMAAPEMIVTSTRYPGASRSEDILDHPALVDLRRAAGIASSDADWVCGTPHILRALAGMRAAREALE